MRVSRILLAGRVRENITEAMDAQTQLDKYDVSSTVPDVGSDGRDAAVPNGVTVQFERFVILLVSGFALLQVVSALVDPGGNGIPPQMTLAVTVGLLMYMWGRENRVRRNLVERIGELNALYAEIEQAHVLTIAAMAKSIEARDKYTHGHSEQVQRLAVALARRMSLSEDRIHLISRSAMLHDIGKVGIADAILHRDGKLTTDEWKVLKGHALRTRDILSPLKFLLREAHIAALHHERRDGSGYPYGLKGDQIPLEASIISIADAFDAMNSDRPYRKKLDAEIIKAELIKGRELHHPPLVVQAFLKLLAEQPELWVRTNGHEAREATVR